MSKWWEIIHYALQALFTGQCGPRNASAVQYRCWNISIEHL
ncbi:hypothetical protein QUA41_15550 [Microcoleus sp. Pol11C1]